MSPSKQWAIYSLVLGLHAPTMAVAQTTNSGVLRQQIEQSHLPTPLRKIAPPKPDEAPAPTGVSVTVEAFRFTGHTLLTAEQLHAAGAPYLHRPLDIAGLRAAADAVEAAYRDAGRMAQALVPPQEFVDGVITIEIVEARFGGATLEQPAPARVAQERLLATVEAGQRRGAPLDATALDRALLLADDLPGVTVAGTLRAGREAGETELALQVADEPLFSGSSVGLDNTGMRATGAGRLTANLQANSPLGLGDSLGASLLHTQGSDYARFAWSLPVGHDGWRLGANGSLLNYQIVAPELRAQDSHGDSTSIGVEATYPLIRTRVHSLSLSLAGEKKTFANASMGAMTTHYAILNSLLTLSGSSVDDLGGGGANSANLVFTQGTVALGALNASEDAEREGTFSKVRYALTRLQTITAEVSGYVAYSGQWADRTLDAAEMFYLGGATGVRAYPAAEGGGTHGQIVNLEVRTRLPRDFTLTKFYDWGQVQVNRNNSAGANPNKIALQGAGVALGWQSPWGLDLKMVWARRIGHNPNPTDSGNDQDGSRHLDRFWFSAAMVF